MSYVDLRGFRYALEPLLRKQQWHVDALQARLAAVDKSIDAARQARGKSQSALDACAHGLRLSGGGRLDPHAYGRGLAYLAALQAELVRKTLHLEKLRLDRDAVREAYVQAQRQVDLTIEHKDECQKEYAVAEQNRVNGEVDREWLARSCAAAQHGEHDE